MIMANDSAVENVFYKLERSIFQGHSNFQSHLTWNRKRKKEVIVGNVYGRNVTLAFFFLGGGVM